MSMASSSASTMNQAASWRGADPASTSGPCCEPSNSRYFGAFPVRSSLCLRIRILATRPAASKVGTTMPRWIKSFVLVLPSWPTLYSRPKLERGRKRPWYFRFRAVASQGDIWPRPRHLCHGLPANGVPADFPASAAGRIRPASWRHPPRKMMSSEFPSVPRHGWRFWARRERADGDRPYHNFPWR